MYACNLPLLSLCLLGLCALSCSLPAPSSPVQQEGTRPLSPRLENARRMWNGAKRAQKRLIRRTRREVNNDYIVTDPAIFANITGQKFIVGLYKNLTNSTLHEKTQANTIRSLTYKRAPAPPCDVFNFTLSPMNSSEFLLNAKLHLYANKPHFPDSKYFVKVTALLANGVELTNKMVHEVDLTADGYVVFAVEDLTSTLISGGEPHAVFVIRVYKDGPDLGDKIPMPCKAIKFVNKDYNDDTEPIFIVYSYNPKIEKINYQNIADTVIENIILAEESPQSPAIDTAGKRRKREVPTCQVNNLLVDSRYIFNQMVGSTASDFSVRAPSYYNAGICGGSCKNVLIPNSMTSNHAPFVYLLVEQPSFQAQHGYTFKRCCAPVRYGPLTVFSVADGTASINVIENLMIKECECLDIIELADPDGQV